MVFRVLTQLMFVAVFATTLFSAEAWSKTTRPSSGRHLRSGHWLTCWGGAEEQSRTDPPFHRGSPEETVASYVPKFSGRYGFEVKDTWEEWVTHSGSDCSRCGQTCTPSGSGNNQTQSCSCNFCSWQELETFYAPWSNQVVEWTAVYVQDQNYRKRRQDWMTKGSPPISRDASDLPKLFEFDPDRPLEYFLFPGEVEVISASNGGGFLSSATSISPRIEVDKARHEYRVANTNSLGRSTFDCDDRNFTMSAQIYTGKRLVTTTPNSIKFNKNWVAAGKNPDGTLKEEPGAFELVDFSARRHENQNVMDHYKETRVQVWLEHVDRFWWLLDTQISKTEELKDGGRRLRFDENAAGERQPAVGVYTMAASELLKTRYFKSEFHLADNQKYSVCTRMMQMKNIYYKTKSWKVFDDWSDENCAMFQYKPPNGEDKRSLLRKGRDIFSRLFGIGLL